MQSHANTIFWLPHWQHGLGVHSASRLFVNIMELAKQIQQTVSVEFVICQAVPDEFVSS